MMSARCARRSSCCTASRRPARAGGGRSRRWPARYRAIAPDLPGHGQAVASHGELRRRARPTCARSRHRSRSRSPATRWAAGSRCTRRSRSARSRSSGCVLVGASPGIGDPRRARRARAPPTSALADRIETDDDRGVRARVGRPAAVRRPAERVAGGAYADRLRNTPRGLAAALRGPRDGRRWTPLWDRLAELDDARDAGRRRARRQVPRDRRAMRGAATATPPGDRARSRARGAARSAATRSPKRSGGPRSDAGVPRARLPVGPSTSSASA